MYNNNQLKQMHGCPTGKVYMNDRTTHNEHLQSTKHELGTGSSCSTQKVLVTTSHALCILQLHNNGMHTHTFQVGLVHRHEAQAGSGCYMYKLLYSLLQLT